MSKKKVTKKVVKKIKVKAGQSGDDFKKYVKAALAVVRPSLQMHGGNVTLISADKKTGLVKVRLRGACVGCSMSQSTLQYGIENFLKEKVKGVKKIENV